MDLYYLVGRQVDGNITIVQEYRSEASLDAVYSQDDFQADFQSDFQTIVQPGVQAFTHASILDSQLLQSSQCLEVDEEEKEGTERREGKEI